MKPNEYVSPRSPKNKFRIEFSTKDPKIENRSHAGSFGTMSIDDLEKNNWYKQLKDHARKCGGAHVTIKENKKVYPEFEWETIKSYSI